MSIITDILKEIPLSSVLKERLADTEKKVAIIESENAALKSKNASLEKDNAELRLQLHHSKQGGPQVRIIDRTPEATYGVDGD